MTKISIGCGVFGNIYAGKLNKEKTMWLDGKQDVTDEATSAVAESLLIKNESFEFEAKGKKYLLTVKEIKK
jgi:hypothetical protein